MFLAEDEVIRVKNKGEKQNLTDFFNKKNIPALQ